MVKKLQFLVPIGSLYGAEIETKNIKIGTVGNSKWFLSLAYHIVDGHGKYPSLEICSYEFKNICVYRFCLDDSSKEEFDLCLHRKNEILFQKKITSVDASCICENGLNCYWDTDEVLKGSITVLDNPERAAHADSEDDETDTDFDSKSISQSEEETPKKCCSSAQLMDDLHSMLDNPDSFTDATLKCGSDSIPVHKCILSARSPVFAAMFQQTEMREGRDGKVVVDDMRPDVVRAMLEYIYTGKSEHVAADSMAGDLLFAADKYQLQKLKSICVGKLRSNMAACNVLRNLVLGDLHDASLKACAIEFICKNKKMSKLEKSEDWKSLEDERPKLAMEVVKSMVKYVQKQGNI